MVYDEGAVLLLESDPKLRGSLVRSIQEFGRRPVEATDVEEALAYLQTTIPGLVVVSLDLPRGDGYDLCEQIRRMVNSTWPPILVTSHRASPLDIAFAEEAGANGFLKKPFTASQLFRYVGVLLDTGMPSIREMRRLRPSEPPPGMVRSTGAPVASPSAALPSPSAAAQQGVPVVQAPRLPSGFSAPKPSLEVQPKSPPAGARPALKPTPTPNSAAPELKPTPSLAGAAPSPSPRVPTSPPGTSSTSGSVRPLMPGLRPAVSVPVNPAPKSVMPPADDGPEAGRSTLPSESNRPGPNEPPLGRGGAK